MNIEEKTKLAYEVLLKLLDKVVVPQDFKDSISLSWAMVDEMEAEAEKRIKAEAKEKREAVRKLLSDDGTFLEKEGMHFDDSNMADSPQLEWQPDWSQAPDGHDWWVMDKDGEASWCSDKPIMSTYDFWYGKESNAPTFDYQGDWKDSLRKRPK